MSRGADHHGGTSCQCRDSLLPMDGFGEDGSAILGWAMLVRWTMEGCAGGAEMGGGAKGATVGDSSHGVVRAECVACGGR